MTKTWVVVVSVAVSLVSVGIASIYVGGQGWAEPGTGEGGSTIPIPPPMPPTPASSADGFLLEKHWLSAAVALHTVDGGRIQLSEGQLMVKRHPSGKQIISLPIALPPGTQLGFFHDPGSGIEWQPGPEGSMRGILTLPVEGAAARLVLQVEETQGNGERMEGVIARVQLMIGPIVTAPESAVNGEVSFAADLEQFPGEAVLTTESIDGTDPGLVASLTTAAAESGARIGDVAYGVKIEVILVTDIPQSEVRPVNVVMKVARSWADSWPEDAIRIGHLKDGGPVAFLATQPVDSDDLGRAAFQAISSEGFSTFALVALEMLPEGTQNGFPGWPGWLGIGLGSAVMLTSLVALVFLQLRRRGLIRGRASR